MMKAHVVRGSKQEIAETVVRIDGAVREVIVFVEEPEDISAQRDEADIFAEMELYTVRTGDADYSRESIYSRKDGE